MPHSRSLRPIFSPPGLVFLTVLFAAAASPAAAQSVSVNVAGSLSNSAPPALSVGVTLRNVSLLAGYGLSARLLGDIGAGGGLEVSGLFDLPLNDSSERLTLYGGPGVALNFARPIRVRPSLVVGLTYDLDGQLSLFGEASYQLQGQYRVRAGVLYSF